MFGGNLQHASYMWKNLSATNGELTSNNVAIYRNSAGIQISIWAFIHLICISKDVEGYVEDVERYVKDVEIV